MELKAFTVLSSSRKVAAIFALSSARVVALARDFSSVAAFDAPASAVSRAAASDDEEAAAGGSNDADIRRLKIIAQATTFVGPKQRKHRGDSWGRLAASHAGGISFKVLGVRWTSKYFAALLVSSGASLLSGLAQRYD